MKGLVLEPVLAEESVLVQYTDNITTDKNTIIKVPNGFSAIVFIDEKIAFRMNSGVGKKVSEYGKEYIGRQCRVAFVRLKLLPSMMWGFGSVPVNNERLQEAYRIGANGKYTVEIIEVAKLINAFAVEQNITLDMIREKTLSVIKNIGTAVLGGYFAKTDISVFEISAKATELREKLFAAIKEEKAFSELGLAVKDLTVAGIHVSEEDLELIRNRINGESTTAEQEERPQVDIKEELSRLQQELSSTLSTEIFRSEQRIKNEQTKSVVSELEKSRNEITKSILQEVQNRLDEFGGSISQEIEDMIIEHLPLREEAKTESIEKIELTAQKLWEISDENSDMVLLAALIYNKVEKNFITKHKLPFKKEKFYMDYKEYIKTASTIKVGNRFPLMKMDKNGALKVIPPIVLEKDEDGTPTIVEMHPIIRFMKAGLSAEEAKRATEMWRILNKIRHYSEENEEYLESFFSERNSRKQYLKEVLDLYSEKGLYTED